MKYLYISLCGLITFFAGCTKNNQNDPSNFAYLSVNQTFLMSGVIQSYDIDNDGQTDWAFTASEGLWLGVSSLNGLNHYSFYLAESDSFGTSGVKLLPYNYPISSNDLYDGQVSPLYDDRFQANILGTGDFYIGFKSQNATRTNSFYGWARLNVSQDFRTLIVKDMAMNKINGASINAGQH